MGCIVRYSKSGRSMFAMGPKRPICRVGTMSTYPPKATESPRRVQ